MTGRADQAAAWIYRGLWGVLVQWFKVPQDPPTLPVKEGEFIHSFQPDQSFLRYMKFWFWLLFWPMDLGIAVAMIAIFATVPWVGLILLVPALIIAIVPDFLVYIGLHLRYDTTWYVMTDRSLRMRRGVWSIHEVTITFENVQNIRVQQGPVQRHFGFANLIVETAGGGGDSHGKGGQTTMNRGMIEGIANAHELRDRILMRLRQSKTAGLGDEDATHHMPQTSWTPEHLTALRAVRDEVMSVRQTIV